MSAIRRPLLCAFVGGCLSNAVLFGLWRTTQGADTSSAQQRHPSHQVVELAMASTAAPSVEQSSEPVAANAAGQARAATEPAPTEAARDLDSAGPTPAGSAVSDVLTQLEAAYRERVSSPAQASSSPERATLAAPQELAMAALEPARGVSAQPIAQLIPATPAATPAAVVEARAVAPAEPAVAPQAAALPALAAQDAPPPSQVHYGDVNQNTYNITNIRQGDVYLIQMQQLAMLQYMQLLGMSSGLAAPARPVGGGGHQRGTLSSGITNPDNPWGFHFAPPNLVR